MPTSGDAKALTAKVPQVRLAAMPRARMVRARLAAVRFIFLTPTGHKLKSAFLGPRLRPMPLIQPVFLRAARPPMASVPRVRLAAMLRVPWLAAVLCARMSAVLRARLASVP
jgi:hypothetical protein